MITPLPKTPNVDNSISKSLWDWLIKIGVAVNQLIKNANTQLTADDVTNTPAGNITSTTVQGAINEFDGRVGVGLGDFKNKLINGNFSIWQRGTSFSLVGNAEKYTADRWSAFAGTSGAATLSRVSYTPGSIYACNSAYCVYFQQTTAGTDAGSPPSLVQRLEGVRTLAGKKAILTFYARADVTLGTTIMTGQRFGTGGSTATYQGPYPVQITTSWQKYTVLIDVPSIAGKTIGTDDFFMMWFRFPISITFSVYIGNVQLEEGTVATPFEQRFIGTELQMCQRYYQAYLYSGSRPGIRVYGYTNAAGGVVISTYLLPVVMRKTPTGLVLGTWNVSNCVQPAFGGISPSGFEFYTTGIAAGYIDAYTTANCGATLDAELL